MLETESFFGIFYFNFYFQMLLIEHDLAQSAGAVEYTDGKTRPVNECPG